MASRSPSGVLVLGAGELGTAMLKALVANMKRGNTSINVLLRPTTITTHDAKKKAEVDALTALGINLVPGDLEEYSVAQLSGIFAIYDTLIGCTGMVGPAGFQTKIAKAVLGGKVRKYIPWQFGLDYDSIAYDAAGGIFSEQKDIRTILRGQSTTKWVIVSTGMFMSFVFEPAFDIVSEDKQCVHALGSWSNRVTLTDVSDIGAITAAVVFDNPEIVDQVVFCAGDTIKYRKVATVLQDMGVDVREEEWSVERLKKELSQDPNNQIKKYRVVFAESDGLAWDEEKTFNFQKGMKTMKLEDWARKNISV